MYLLLLVSICYFTSILAVATPHYAIEVAHQHFEHFMMNFAKQYANEEEKAMRFEIFKMNLEKINRLNRESEHAVFDITEFTDLTSEEFNERHTGLREPTRTFGKGHCIAVGDESTPNSGAPASFDWRHKNVVTTPKHQWGCQSCYAFSAIGNIESQYAMKYGRLLDLSEQQIVDCDTLSSGCQGGYPYNSFSELIRLGGSMYEVDYPYENRQHQCSSNPLKTAVRLSKCYTFHLSSQEKVKQLLFKNGPLVIGIQGNSLQQYQGGIVHDSSCNGPLNHAVLLVGYGTEGNIPYWIVKNSYGPRFGEQGYFRLQRSNNPRGACAMLNPTISTALVQ